MSDQIKRLFAKIVGWKNGRHITVEQLKGFYNMSLPLKEQDRLLAHGRRCPGCKKLLDRAPYLTAVGRGLEIWGRLQVGLEVTPEMVAAATLHVDRMTLADYARDDMGNEVLLQRVERHLEKCEECRQAVELIRLTNSLLPDEPPLGAPDGWNRAAKR